MFRFLLRPAALAIVASMCMATPCVAHPDTLWTRVIGCFGESYPHSVRECPDSGFVVCGYTNCFGLGGNKDTYLIRTDARGDTIWTRTYPRPGHIGDYGRCVTLTDDGGFMIAGWTDGWVSGSTTYLFEKAYAVKTDDEGNPAWMEIYGQSYDNDRFYCVEQNAAGNYIMAGSTWRDGSHMQEDLLLACVNPQGNLLWREWYGDQGSEVAYSVRQTPDGSYVVAGTRRGTVGEFGSYDIYLMKTDDEGNEIWTKTYGTSRHEYAYSIRQTADGGFIVAGSKELYPPSGRHSDVYLLKIDMNGDTLWTRTYGGTDWDIGYDVAVTSRGDFIVVGMTESFGNGGGDMYVVMTSAVGDTLCTAVCGGTDDDCAYAVEEASDGGCLVAGSSKSYGTYGNVVYLVRFAARPDLEPPGLGLGVLQNPYLTRYLDIYLIGSEPLDSASVELRVNDQALATRLVDRESGLWSADYRLPDGGGAITLTGCGADSAGNDTCVTATFSSVLMCASEGGTLSSPDERVSVVINPGVLVSDAYLLMLPCSGHDTHGLQPEDPGEGELTRHLAGGCKPPTVYYIGPEDVLAGGSAYLEFHYTHTDLGVGGSPGDLCIEQAGVGALRSYVDAERATVGVSVSRFGDFRLLLGTGSATETTDPYYLKIYPSLPNPSPGNVTVRLEVRERQRARVTVYDVTGRAVARLMDGYIYPGIHEINWDGTGGSGLNVTAGLYLVRVETDHSSATGKIIRIK